MSPLARRRRVLAVIATALAGAVIAGTGLAAEPDSGTVSATSPSVTWTGEAETAPFARQMRDEQLRSCVPAICDTFALTVADAGELTVLVKGEAKGVGVQLVAPDGTAAFADNFDGDPAQPVTIVVQNAKPGAYTVEMWQDASELDRHQLSGSARLRLLAPAAAAQPQSPPPTTAPAPASSQPSRPATTLTVRTDRVRARATARRRLSLRIASSGTVTDVRAQLLLKRRVTARGALARLDGSGKIVLRTSRALKPGRYTVGLTATDASGARIAVSRRLVVTR